MQRSVWCGIQEFVYCVVCSVKDSTADDETNDDVVNEGSGGAAARVSTARNDDEKLVTMSS